MHRSVKLAYQCLVGSVVLGWLGLVARADIVLESFTDQRPLDAEYILAPLKTALERRRVVTKPALILEARGEDLPLSGNPDRDITRTKLIERIDRGIARAAHEAYDEAVTILDSVLRDLENNPALAAADPESRSWVTKARVALTFAYIRSKQLKLATDTIMDHIRSYPDYPLTSVQEEVERLYGVSVRSTGSGAHGMLVFSVNLPDAEIFVNEVERGRGKIDVTLVPGGYRVVVRGTGVFRRYHVTVRPNERVERVVDWPADSAFTATPDWIGFVGPRRAQRSVAAFVDRMVQRGPGDAVILIGIVQHDGRRYLTARRYSAAAVPLPGRAVEVRDDINAAGIEDLASYITADAPDAARLPWQGLLDIPGDDEVAVGTGASARWPLLAAIGVLGTAVPLGAYLVKSRNDCFTGCSSFTAPAGWGLLGLGGLAIGFGIALIIHGGGASHSPLVGMQPLPGGAMASIHGSF